ncbi:MAG: response regulator [Synergistaceae bacterium]|nr:response regulator [Synergistaceae bacterium]
MDDTPDNIWVLAEVLKEDYTIMVARDGRSALDVASRAQGPDVILLDVLMPEMDGYEVCSLLKKNEATRNIPVIFVTSQDDSGHEAMGLELGAVDYIGKPFVPSLVRARVCAQLELKRHRDDLEGLVRDRTRELEVTRQFIISALANLAEWRDASTGEHIHRTKSYVKIIAEELQPLLSGELTDDLVRILCFVAPLHDIGKVCVPDAILQKPGRLTPEEYEVMKRHTTCARKVLDSAGDEIGGHIFLRAARELVYSHHERWDGGGYPEGISGDGIPLVARIMAVADVYDALISRRVYKPPFTHEEAVRLIFEGRGTQFDPNVVDAFMKRESDFAVIARQHA